MCVYVCEIKRGKDGAGGREVVEGEKTHYIPVRVMLRLSEQMLEWSCRVFVLYMNITCVKQPILCRNVEPVRHVHCILNWGFIFYHWLDIMSQWQTDVCTDWWFCTTHKLLYSPPPELFLPYCVILSAGPDCHPLPCHRHYLAANPPRLTAVQTAMVSWLVNAGQLESDICAVAGWVGGCWCVKLGGQGRWWSGEEEEEDG